MPIHFIIPWFLLPARLQPFGQNYKGTATITRQHPLFTLSIIGHITLHEVCLDPDASIM